MALKDWRLKWNNKFQKLWVKGDSEVFVQAQYFGDNKYKWSMSASIDDNIIKSSGFTTKARAMKMAKSYMRSH